ncbi:MAG: 1-(5-phosphoribosyl)-5-[(5-phosphoribosylamino)methylideneamino]imidazole-4-carboxamide isomerase [Dehalococcoidia bacterium]|nr:1-(5-phosphoribosyl)-5-[(5-phosphoribosylamino)methylideneamino]imidazole-4-carboxamide isomerase [Chloroflexota bacterium]MCK4243078.1 1-(5-phosphoribosyl)-5-[(5-phosphoribosylamino)methylideneamino]imidazole-4-carboxamide isomerase [Dehalococcoidia bacterium]
MEIIPAIDLRQGRCVRLYQGDFSQETLFSPDPVAVAVQWQSLGAPRLHIVDLDGASQGELCHASLVEEIVASVKIPLQLGGGLRRLDVVEQVLDMGVERAILGTAAIEDHGLVREVCQKFGERIIVSIDAIEGFVASHGWREKTTVAATELVEKMASLGVGRFIYTDITRDGTLTEPNFRAIADLIDKTNLPVIASGGIAKLEHLERLAEIGVEGAIIGRALYTGDLDLGEALAVIG